MPKALIILPEAPYPAIGGGPLRTASILQPLAKQFDLTAIHFRLDGDPDPALDYPPNLLTKSHTLNLPHHAKSFLPRLTRNLKRALQGIPPLVDRFSGHNQTLQQILNNENFDLIWLEHFWLAPYAALLKPHTKKLILDLHNIESAYYTSLAQASPKIHHPLLNHFARQAKHYENTLLPQFDLVLTTSNDDKKRINHPNTHVLPNTIPVHPSPHEPKTPTIVFTGNFAYTPNQQALHWFLQNVWSTVLKTNPNIRLRLVGKEIRYAHSTAPNIDYIGPVENAVTEIAKSRLAIVPLQSGSGTRLKILEAFAASTPVISTKIGAEGLDAIPGQHYELANSPEAFSQSILDLFDNKEQCTSMAQAARQLYEQNYTWNAAAKVLADLRL